MNPPTDFQKQLDTYKQHAIDDAATAVKQTETEKVNQLQVFKDVTSTLQAMVTAVEDTGKGSQEAYQGFGGLLTQIKSSLDQLSSQEAPEVAQPIVEAIQRLESAVAVSKQPPKINVAAPSVNVASPKVDLRGVESILKTDLPQALQTAIDTIPQPETPEPIDWTPVLEALSSIETGVRMKPIMPLTIKVTNPDGTNVGGGSSGAVTNDGTFATPAKQDTGNASLASIDSKLTNPLPISGAVTTGGLTDTQLRATAVPVSNTNLDVALSTRLKPADTLTKVATVDTITNSVAITVTDGADAGEGATTDAAVAAGAAGSVSAKFRRLTTDIGAVKTSVASLDTKTTAANTGAVVVSSSALPTGAATSAIQTTQQTSLTSIDGKLSGTLSTSGTTTELTGLMPKVFDYIAANLSGSTADVYTYKAGGSGGTTAATLTVTWTDSTKTVLSTVVRT